MRRAMVSKEWARVDEQYQEEGDEAAGNRGVVTNAAQA